MRRSASAPISASAIARMSAAKAIGSAWKLPPDRTSRDSLKTSGLSETAFASRSIVPAAKADEVEGGAHHLRLAAQRVRVLDAVVAGAVRLADGAARQPGS